MNPRRFLLIPIVATFAAAQEPEARLGERHVAFRSREPIQAVDLVRHRDQWICVVATKSGLRLMGSKSGVRWRPLSVVKSQQEKRPLRTPRLSVTSDSQLLLTAVRPGVQVGGDSFLWRSKEGIHWSGPQRMAESGYLVSSVRWREGQAYAMQFGSICGSTGRMRLGVGGEGEGFRTEADVALGGGYTQSGSLVFTEQRAYCVMPFDTFWTKEDGTRRISRIGVSAPPFDEWRFKTLPYRFTNLNTLRARNGVILVTATRHREGGKREAWLFRLDTASLRLDRILRIPTNVSAFIGMARQANEVVVAYPSSREGRFEVSFARIVMARSPQRMAERFPAKPSRSGRKIK